MWLSQITIKNCRNFELPDGKLGENAVVLGENQVGNTPVCCSLRV